MMTTWPRHKMIEIFFFSILQSENNTIGPSWTNVANCNNEMEVVQDCFNNLK
jgi:hypothetical protein